MSEIQHPFTYEVTWNCFTTEIQAEHICHLSSEDSNCDTAGETYDYRIWNEFNDSS